MQIVTKTNYSKDLERMNKVQLQKELELAEFAVQAIKQELINR